MPRSFFATFTDPLQQASAMRGADADLLCMSKTFRSSHKVVDFDRVWTMSNRMEFTGVARASAVRHRVPIGFAPRAHAGSLRVQNLDLAPGEILVLRRDGPLNFQAAGATQFSTASMMPEDLAVAAQAITGREVKLLPEAHVLRPDPVAMTRLVGLHEAVGQLAKMASEPLAQPQISKGLEQDLIHAFVRCLTFSVVSGSRRESTPHTLVIRRFEEFLEANRYQPIYLAEMCAGINVSERTLRACCQEHFGMGPIRYLWLRRMHLASRAMAQAKGEKTVTQIATEYGFWELGRFSVEYRTLFGEPPSATLRRARVGKATLSASLAEIA